MPTINLGSSEEIIALICGAAEEYKKDEAKATYQKYYRAKGLNGYYNHQRVKPIRKTLQHKLEAIFGEKLTALPNDYGLLKGLQTKIK